MNRRVCSALILVGTIMIAKADEQVRSTQEELRRRNLYFGDIDGRSSSELQEALKRYQKRKGLASTGDNDRETLRSLGIVARAPGEPPPKELQLPDEPVLKSDTRISVAAEAQEIAADTGVSVAAVAQGRVVAPPPGHALHRPTAAGPSPVKSDGSSAEAPRFSVRDTGHLQGNLQHYVHNYLSAVSHNHLDDELRFYADRVNYLGNGWVDRRIIENSLRKYYQRWPRRDYSNIKDLQYEAHPSRGEIVVRFRAGFNLHNGSKSARGETDNEIVINAATADPRIVSISERRVHR